MGQEKRQAGRCFYLRQTYHRRKSPIYLGEPIGNNHRLSFNRRPVPFYRVSIGEVLVSVVINEFENGPSEKEEQIQIKRAFVSFLAALFC